MDILNNEELAEYKKNAKEKIAILINENKLEEAEVLTLDYENNIKDDIEIYSIKAIILIGKEKYNDAENILKEGLKKQKNNFDILYNLAFVKELKKEYKEAIKFYKKCNSFIVGNYELKKDIDNIIENLIQKEKELHKKEITVLIPTRNRPDYVVRCVEHFYKMNDNDLKVNIMLLDGSDDDKKEDNKKFIMQLDENLVEVIQYNIDTWPYDRVCDAVKKVKTKFCCICADDDFLQKDGIISAIEMLNSNGEFGSVVGKMLRFKEGELQQFYRGQGFQFSSIMEDNPIERLCNFYGKNELLQLIYLVYRTETLAEVLNNIDLHALNREFQEILWYFNVVVAAKVAKIDEILILREIANNDNTTKFIKANFYDLMVDGTFNNQYNKFKDILKKFLLKKLKTDEMLDEVCLDQKIHDIFSMYLKRWDIADKYIIMNNGNYDLNLLKEAMDINGWDKI